MKIVHKRKPDKNDDFQWEDNPSENLADDYTRRIIQDLQEISNYNNNIVEKDMIKVSLKFIMIFFIIIISLLLGLIYWTL
jgi:hypothetical protein